MAKLRIVRENSRTLQGEVIYIMEEYHWWFGWSQKLESLSFDLEQVYCFMEGYKKGKRFKEGKQIMYSE